MQSAVVEAMADKNCGIAYGDEIKYYNFPAAYEIHLRDTTPDK